MRQVRLEYPFAPPARRLKRRGSTSAASFDPRDRSKPRLQTGVEHSIARLRLERGLPGRSSHGGRDGPERLRSSASAGPVNRRQRGGGDASKGTKTHGMERVLPCRQRLGSTTDSSVEQRLEGGRCARPRLNPCVGNGARRRLVGRVPAGWLAASCGRVLGSLSRRALASRPLRPLASASARTRSGGCKARAFSEGWMSWTRCWALLRDHGVDIRGATAAVTRCGCRRGEVFEGYMRVREGHCGELARGGTPERVRTP